MTQKESNGLEDMAAFLAFYHKRDGIEAYRNIFAALKQHRPHSLYQELYEPVIEDLRATGLLDAANDLEIVTKDLPHDFEMPCPDHYENYWKNRCKERKAAWEAKNSLKTAC